ncbi:ribonuclease E [Alkalilimnicola ehrlichii MLHE-1]|uniref:Ribonuclease E n=1 Tax=Alkalilimnicola ehrlichii (strain ATCC BAA-1101 / DSM 17681 / MLHE-1) TaxID=187272 RepID=Q0A8Q8_ALKEH|nr:ribonuclease E [Alkalilimnicola ehrlichii]ABI56779.1 RNAse E [Alkalilimnicola ehrlichii MLHE-1]
MKRMLINATQPEELRVALVDGQQLYDLDIETPAREQKKANIYKGTITRVEPSLEAAFVQYGAERHGFLPFKEIAPSYYREGLKADGGRPSIRDAVREGQEVVVQVDKEERGTKGAALTTYISLAGRYLVLMPNNPRAGGVSRRIEGSDRAEIREALRQLDVPEGMGLIVRTAGVGRTVEELQWDLDYLLKLWSAIQKAAEARSAPFLIYQESDVIIRALRDYLRSDIGEILIDDPQVFEKAVEFVEQVMPYNRQKLKYYDDRVPLFTRYQIESQIESAFQRDVRLPSGGAIVIDHTEALISIDINSARATKGSDIEETALHTNLEAADEIARQLRLRDLGGLIVIDFIDMGPNRNQREVENRLREAVKADRARVQIGRISRFGLLEMSRQRLRSSLGESHQEVCARCGGQGTVRSVESLALSILRIVEEEAMKEKTGTVLAQLPVDVATFLLNEKRPSISEIEDRHRVAVVLIPNRTMETPHYDVQRLRSDDESTEDPSYRLASEEHPEPSPEWLEREAAPRSEEPVVQRVQPPSAPPPTAPVEESPKEEAPPPQRDAPEGSGASDVGISGLTGLFQRLRGFFGREADNDSAGQEGPVGEKAPAASGRRGSDQKGATNGRRGGGSNGGKGGRTRQKARPEDGRSASQPEATGKPESDARRDADETAEGAGRSGRSRRGRRGGRRRRRSGSTGGGQPEESAARQDQKGQTPPAAEAADDAPRDRAAGKAEAAAERPREGDRAAAEKPAASEKVKADKPALPTITEEEIQGSATPQLKDWPPRGQVATEAASPESAPADDESGTAAGSPKATQAQRPATADTEASDTKADAPASSGETPADQPTGAPPAAGGDGAKAPTAEKAAGEKPGARRKRSKPSVQPGTPPVLPQDIGPDEPSVRSGRPRISAAAPTEGNEADTAGSADVAPREPTPANTGTDQPPKPAPEPAPAKAPEPAPGSDSEPAAADQDAAPAEEVPNAADDGAAGPQATPWLEHEPESSREAIGAHSAGTPDAPDAQKAPADTADAADTAGDEGGDQTQETDEASRKGGSRRKGPAGESEARPESPDQGRSREDD